HGARFAEEAVGVLRDLEASLEPLQERRRGRLLAGNDVLAVGERRSLERRPLRGPDGQPVRAVDRAARVAGDEGVGLSWRGEGHHTAPSVDYGVAGPPAENETGAGYTSLGGSPGAA